MCILGAWGFYNRCDGDWVVKEVEVRGSWMVMGAREGRARVWCSVVVC
jgi:hypothetical protein